MNKLKKGEYTIIPISVLESEILSSTQKLLLLGIWSYTFNREGNRNSINQDTLSRIASISERTLYYNLQILKNKGYIETELVRVEKCKNPRRVITLNIEKIKKDFNLQFEEDTSQIKEKTYNNKEIDWRAFAAKRIKEIQENSKKW